MNISIEKVPKEWFGSGRSYIARAVDKTGKFEHSQMLMSFQNLPKFITDAESALKETCSEVVFYKGTIFSWTKTRDEIFNQEKVGHV